MHTAIVAPQRRVVAPGVSGHIPALDGLRGLAILMVMFYHQCIMDSAMPVDRAFKMVCGYGAYGVDLFFVLSGFLITGILLDTKEREGYLRNFYARRTLRIFPLYYAVVFFSLAILPHLNHPKLANFGRIAGDEIWYWTYLSNFSIAHAGQWRHGILDVSWSLAIEEQFYLVWPTVVLLLSTRALRRVCVGMICGAFLFRVALVLVGCPSISMRVLTPARLDGLAIGAWIAISCREGVGGIDRMAGTARRLFLPIGLACVATAVLMECCAAPDVEAPDPVVWKALLAVMFGLLALLFGVSLVQVVAAERGSLCHAFFASRPMMAFGKYSYALYLFHLPLRALIRDIVFPPQQFPQFMGSRIPGQLLFFVASTAITFVAAWLSWNLYEKHFLSLKKFFEYRGRD